jgi:hypothetical protein
VGQQALINDLDDPVIGCIRPDGTKVIVFYLHDVDDVRTVVLCMIGFPGLQKPVE